MWEETSICRVGYQQAIVGFVDVYDDVFDDDDIDKEKKKGFYTFSRKLSWKSFWSTARNAA